MCVCISHRNHLTTFNCLYMFLSLLSLHKHTPMYTHTKTKHTSTEMPLQACILNINTESFVNSCHYSCTHSQQGSSRRWSIFNLGSVLSACSASRPSPSTLVLLMFRSAIMRNGESHISPTGFFNIMKMSSDALRQLVC